MSQKHTLDSYKPFLKYIHRMSPACVDERLPLTTGVEYAYEGFLYARDERFPKINFVFYFGYTVLYASVVVPGPYDCPSWFLSFSAAKPPFPEKVCKYVVDHSVVPEPMFRLVCLAMDDIVKRSLQYYKTAPDYNRSDNLLVVQEKSICKDIEQAFSLSIFGDSCSSESCVKEDVVSVKDLIPVEKQQIRVVSDGTAEGTNVFYSDGSVIPFVKSVSFSIDAETGLSECTLVLFNVEADATADAGFAKK